jgi:hypothetical protein
MIIRLILVVVRLYLNFTYVISVFSLPLIYQRFSSNYSIQPIAISVSVTSVFSLLVSTTISDLIILEFIF